MPSAEDLAGALIEPRSVMRANLQQRATDAALSVIGQMDAAAFYSPRDVRDMAHEIVRYVEATQRDTARMTDAWLRQIASQMTRRRLRATEVIDPSLLRKGTTHAGAYGRLADQYRYDIASGMPVETVLERMKIRAQIMIATDLQLALRSQSREWLQSNDIFGWRRVLRPEMSKTGTCALCIVAADRVYSTDDLMPIHDRCNCDVLPIVGGIDPGLQLNSEDLDSLYRQADGKDAGSLKAVRLRIVEHSELGPQLTNAAHRSRTGRDVARSTRQRSRRNVVDPIVAIRAQIASLEASYANLLAREAAGEDVSRPLTWQRNRLAELRAQLRQY